MRAAIAQPSRGGLTISWRTIEWWGAGVALFLQTGALFPLIMSGAGGDLSDAAKSKLRLLSLPVYLFAVLILLRNRRDFLIAVNRNLPFQLLLVMPLLSVLWSVGPSTTLRRAVGMLFSVLLAYALAIRFTPRQLLLLTMVSVGATIVLSIVLMGITPRLARMPDGSAIRGAFFQKNSLGWYSGLLALAAAMVARDATIGFRRTAIVLLVAALACLVVSTSMTASIATASACGLFWIYSTLSRLRGVTRFAFVLVMLHLVVLLLVTLHLYLTPFLEALGKDATLTGRIPLWDLVDQQIAHRFILGFGFQAFWTEGNPDAWTVWSSAGWMAPHAHNGFRDMMLSFGIVGTSLYALVIIRAIRDGATLLCREPEEGWLWLNILLGMILVMNLTESILLNQNDFIVTLLSTAMIMFSLHAPSPSASHSPRGPIGNLQVHNPYGPSFHPPGS